MGYYVKNEEARGIKEGRGGCMHAMLHHNQFVKQNAMD